MVHSRRFYSAISIICLLFFALASYFFEGMQQITLWIAVPGAAIFAFLAVSDHKPNRYMKLQIALYLWIAFTALSAYDDGLAMKELVRIFGCSLLIVAFDHLSKDNRLITWLYLVYIVLYLGMVNYARTNILTDLFDYTEDRLGNERLNANMMAYFTFFTTFTIYILANTFKRRWVVVLFQILFLLSPVWSFLIAILTASRQVIVIQIPLIAFLLYIRYFMQKKLITKIVFIALCIFIGAVMLRVGAEYYEGSALSQRNELNIEDDARMSHIKNAIKTGLEHPIVGVGPGCYGIYSLGVYTFSHNNYTELFANSGFPALVLCVVMFWKFIKTQWKRYFKTRDIMFFSFFTFGLIYAIDNMFYVFYTSPWLIAFFFLVAGHSENYYQMNYNFTSTGNITNTFKR